jgi:regulator of nucleoside diphosphate kinase
MNQFLTSEADRSPNIVLGNNEHHKLLVLAMAHSGHAADDADWLLHELDRAEVLPDEVIPSDVVRMDSTVRFSTSGSERTVTLVFPEYADINTGRIYILTPIGTALLGLRPGQSINWLTRDGRKQRLTVTEILNGDNCPPC